ncbi:hypothetical protein F383_15274 [Gossypium arboreum]|uniref:Uncharacterized protein n=1 Tax=Gossypium arboreum TaxID=29729 RepID=A0A0B0NI69_GOSAR|nr:hypothetical protein F383_15274 [Gossypium arboreum]
MSFKSLLCMC